MTVVALSPLWQSPRLNATTWLAIFAVIAMVLVPTVNTEYLPPITSLRAERVGALMSCVAAALAWMSTRNGFATVPVSIVPLALLVVYLGAQALVKSHGYIETATLTALYIVLAALTLWTGATLARKLGRQTLSIAIALGLTAAAIFNAACGLIQFYELTASPLARLTVWAVEPGTNARAYGNVANANLLALTLLLGIAAIGYLRLIQAISTAVALAATTLILWTLVLTASRWPVLAIVWIVTASIWFAWRVDMTWTRQIRAAALIVAMLFVALSLLIDALGLGPVQSLWRRVGDEAVNVTDGSSGIRIYLWRQAIGMFISAPWFGVGVGGYRATMFERVTEFGSSAKPGLDPTAHNIVLTILAEWGLVGLMLMLVALLPLVWRLIRRTPRPRQAFALIVIGVLLIHSLLEAPLWYAHYLCAFTLIAAVDARSYRFRNGEWVRAMAAIAIAVGFAVSFHLVGEARALRLIHGASIDRPAFEAWLATQERDGQFRVRGLLRPQKEFFLWEHMAVGVLDPQFTVAQTEPVMRYLPSGNVVAHRIVALWRLGRPDEARALAARMVIVAPRGALALSEIIGQWPIHSGDDWAPLLRVLQRL